MIKFLIPMLLISGSAFAGIGACHDGNGNITALNRDANPVAFAGQNCAYYKDADYERVNAKIENVLNKYVKWDEEPTEMTAQEKDAVDQVEADALAAAILSSARTGAKNSVDELSAEGVRLRAALLVTLERTNEIAAKVDAIDACNTDNSTAAAIRSCIIALDPLGQATATQMKTAIKNKIDAGDTD